MRGPVERGRVAGQVVEWTVVLGLIFGLSQSEASYGRSLASPMPTSPVVQVASELKEFLSPATRVGSSEEDIAPTRQERLLIRRQPEPAKFTKALMLATSSGENLGVWRIDQNYKDRLFPEMDLVILAQGQLTAREEAERIGNGWDVALACRQAEMLILAGGWYDVLRQSSPTVLEPGFKLFYDRAVAACPSGVEVVALGPPPMAGRDANYIRNLLAINDLERSVTVPRGGTYVDLVALLSQKNKLGELAAEYVKDPWHINARAWMAVSKALPQIRGH